MFSLREFIKKGLLDAVGKLPDYQIIINAAGWYDKGVLLEEDLEDIQNAIDAQYPDPNKEVQNEETEELSE